MKTYLLRILGSAMFGLLIEAALWPLAVAVISIISYEAVKWIKHL